MVLLSLVCAGMTSQKLIKFYFINLLKFQNNIKIAFINILSSS